MVRILRKAGVDGWHCSPNKQVFSPGTEGRDFYANRKASHLLTATKVL
jgi:hypothetical protein